MFNEDFKAMLTITESFFSVWCFVLKSVLCSKSAGLIKHIYTEMHI